MKMTEKIYIAGGCYWGMEHYLKKIPGIISTTVGFSGGKQTKIVNYTTVSTGLTGHTETVEVEFDPKVLTTRHLLFEFFRLHNPTTINQQGNDKGTQYRSAIFYMNEDQKKIATEVIKKVDQSGEWGASVVTELKAFTNFFAADEAHQDYLTKRPDGYNCHIRHPYDFGE